MIARHRPRVKRLRGGALCILAGAAVLSTARAQGTPGGDDPAPLDLPPGTRPAVAIWTPLPESPPEAYGTGIAPEVSLRLDVDARGRVADLEIVSIDPTTELDGVFEEQVRSTIGGWRYAPARRDGVPTSTILRFTVTFPERTVERPKRGEIPVDFRNVKTPSDLLDREARIRALPLEARKRALLESSKIAVQYMDVGSVKKAVSDRFVVYTNVDSEGTAEALARNLEAGFNFLHDLFGLTPQPEPYRVQVFLFSRRNDFFALTQRLGVWESAEAFYSAVGMIAMHVEMVSNDAFLETLLHEATHAYMDRHIVRPGLTLPRWFSEGIAEYVGASKIDKGQVIPGRIQRRSMYRGPWGQFSGKSTTQIQLEAIRDEMRGTARPPVDALLEHGPEAFYGKKAVENYLFSWMLIHFLRHGVEDGETKFRDLLLFVAEGVPAERALESIYGPVDDWREDFRKHIRRIA